MNRGLLESAFLLGKLYSEVSTKLGEIGPGQIGALRKYRGTVFERSVATFCPDLREGTLERLYFEWLSHLEKTESGLFNVTDQIGELSQTWTRLTSRGGHLGRSVAAGTGRSDKIIPIRGTCLISPPETVPSLVGQLDRWLPLQPSSPAWSLIVSGILCANLAVLSHPAIPSELLSVGVTLSFLFHHNMNPGGFLTLGSALGVDREGSLSFLEDGWWSEDLTSWLDRYLHCLISDYETLIKLMDGLRKSQPKMEPGPKVNERQKRILEELSATEFVTNRDYRRLFLVSNKTAHQELRDLVEKNLIKKLGFGRAVQYVLARCHDKNRIDSGPAQES